jgi:valyl-tRNA synthetase
VRTGPPELPESAVFTLPERWLLSRHQAMLEEVDTAFGSFRFAEAAQAIHRFFWSELCDWALEMEKERLYEGSDLEREAASEVLAWVLERSLRVLHPIMPFVTEEVWLRFEAGESIVIAPWPEQRPEHRDAGAESRFGFVQELVTALRRFRKSHSLPDKRPIPSVRTTGTTAEQQAVMGELHQEMKRIANITFLDEEDADPGAGGAARLMVDGAEVVIPLAHLLDVDAERQRLTKRLNEVEGDAAKHSAKLANEGFLAKAPEAVVAQERARLAALQQEAVALREQLDDLG